MKDTMNQSKHNLLTILFSAILALSWRGAAAETNIGVGARPVPGAEIAIDGTRETLDAKWIYWKAPASSRPCPSSGKSCPTRWTGAPVL